MERDDRKQAALDGSGRYADSGLEPVEDFTGRQWLFSAIDKWRASPERILAVIGPPGVGKTSLFAELAYHQAVAAEQDRWLSAVWTCSEHRTNPSTAVRILAAQLCATVPGFTDVLLEAPDNPLDRTIDIRIDMIARYVASGAKMVGAQIELHESALPEVLERLLWRPLRTLRPEQPIIVAVDGLDQAVSSGTPTLAELILRDAAHVPIRFVVSSRGDPRIWETTAGLTRVDVRADAPAGLAEVSDYVESRLAAVLSGEQRHTVARLIQDASEDNFLYAYHATKGILDGDPPPARATDLPHGLTGWYRQFLERELRPPGNAAAETRWSAIIRPCLELLLCCRSEGFGAADLTRMTSLGDTEVEDFHRIAGQYLRGDRRSWRFYHPSFAQFLIDDADGPAAMVSLRSGHSAIAAAAFRDWAGEWAECSDEYVLEHLPYHLGEMAARAPSRGSGRAERAQLYDLLTDPDFADRQVRLARTHSRLLPLPAGTLRAALQTALSHGEYAAAVRLMVRLSRTQRQMAVWSPAELVINADVGAALAATTELAPHDALMWQLLIAVYLRESGQAEQARQLAQEALRRASPTLPDKVAELAAWCTARLAPLLEPADVDRMADMLLDGYERQLLILHLIRAGEFEKAVSVLRRMSGGFEHDRAARGLIYHALATLPVKDVRTVAHLVLDRLPRSLLHEPFGTFPGSTNWDGSYDEVGDSCLPEYEECVRVCQAVLGIRAATLLALDETAETDSIFPDRSARARLLAVLAATQSDDRYQAALSSLVRSARQHLATCRAVDIGHAATQSRDHAAVLYEYGRCLFWSGRRTEARQVFEEVIADHDRAGFASGMLHSDIFHGDCEQHDDIEHAVYLGAVGLLQPVLDLAAHYTGKGSEDGVRALLRVRDWTRAADPDQLSRIDSVVAECLNQLPEKHRLPEKQPLRAFCALATRETRTYLPEQGLLLLGRVLAEPLEAETVGRRAAAQTLAHLARAWQADGGLIDRSFELAADAGPSAVTELIGTYTAAVIPDGILATGADLRQETAEDIIWDWVCHGRLAEARLLTDQVLTRFGESSWQTFWTMLDASRDRTRFDPAEVGRLAAADLVALAVSAAREGRNAAVTWLREQAENRLGLEIDTKRRDHQFKMRSPWIFNYAAANAAWRAALYGLLGNVTQANQAMSQASWFITEETMGLNHTWPDMRDQRADTAAREKEEAASLRLRCKMRIGWFLWLGGDTREGQDAVKQVVQELRQLQNPDVASTVAGDIAEVAADIGLPAEALQAADHVLDDREIRFARVAGRIAATAGGRRLPPEFDELVLQVARSGRLALAVAGLLAIASGGAGIAEVREEIEAWLTSSTARNEEPAVTGGTRPALASPDPAASAEAEERWDNLVGIQSRELSKARSAVTPDPVQIRNCRRALSRALWQARRYEEEIAVWQEALAEADDEADLTRRQLSESLVCQGRLDEAVDLWRAAAAAADSRDEPDARQRDQYQLDLTRLYRLAERWDDLADMWSAALVRARDAGDTEYIRRCEQELAWSHERAGHPERGVEVWNTGLALARAAVPPDQERIRQYLGQLRLSSWSGEPTAEVLAVWSAELAAALARGDGDAANHAREELAAGYRHGKQYAAEAELWRNALEATTSDSEQAWGYRCSLDLSLRELRRPDELIAMWRTALSDARQADSDFTAVEAALRRLADAYAFAERPDDEIRVWIELLDVAREQPANSLIYLDNRRRHLAAAYRRRPAGPPARLRSGSMRCVRPISRPAQMLSGSLTFAATGSARTMRPGDGTTSPQYCATNGPQP